MFEQLQRFFKFLKDEGYQVEQTPDLITVNYENIQVEINYNSTGEVYEFTVVGLGELFEEYPIKAIQHLVKSKFLCGDNGRLIFKDKLSYTGMFELYQGLHACIAGFKEVMQKFVSKKTELDKINLLPRYLRLKDLPKVYGKNFILEVDFEYFSKFFGNKSKNEFINFTVFGKLANEGFIHAEIYLKKEDDYCLVREFEMFCSNMREFLDQCFEKVNSYSLDLNDKA